MTAFCFLLRVFFLEGNLSQFIGPLY